MLFETIHRSLSGVWFQITLPPKKDIFHISFVYIIDYDMINDIPGYGHGV